MLPTPQTISIRQLWVLRLYAFMVCIVACSIVSTAQAQTRVVILEFKGAKANVFQRTVVPLVASTATVIPNKKYQSVTESISQFRANSSGLKQVAKSLKLDGYVEGKVIRQGKKYNFTLEFLDSDGKYIDEIISFRSKKNRLSSRQKKRLRLEISRILREMAGSNAEPIESTMEQDSPVSSTGPSDSDGAMESTGDTLETNSARRNAEVPPRGRLISDRDRPIELQVGMTYGSRQLTFVANQAAAPPQGYDMSYLVPGMFLEGNIFPWALDADEESFLRNVGVTAVFDRVLFIESKLQSDSPPGAMTGPDVAVSTVQSRIGIGLVYRYNVAADDIDGVSLRASIRYTSLKFELDKSDTPDITIPNVQYSYIEPGLSAVFPLSGNVALWGSARYLAILDSGEMEDETNFYGTGSRYGVDVTASLKYKITPQLVFTGGLHYTVINSEFDGEGRLTDRDRDGIQDVASAKDLYFSLFATAGYLY